MDSPSHFQVFRECLIASAQGPFFPDWEFPTIFGFERSEVDAIAQSFTPETAITGEVRRAVQSSIGNLLGYPHDQDLHWPKWISVTPEELSKIYKSWTASNVV